MWFKQCVKDLYYTQLTKNIPCDYVFDVWWTCSFIVRLHFLPVSPVYALRQLLQGTR